MCAARAALLFFFLSQRRNMMIRSQFLSTIALAAALGVTVPAIAASKDDASKANGANAAQSSSQYSSTDRSDKLPSSATRSMNDAAKPDCSSFKNPNAGKLADKDTGAAKEHSASPVHMDCNDSSAASTTSGALN